MKFLEEVQMAPNNIFSTLKIIFEFLWNTSTILLANIIFKKTVFLAKI